MPQSNFSPTLKLTLKVRSDMTHKSYRLGKLILKWDHISKSWLSNDDCDGMTHFFYSEQALIDAGATPLPEAGESEPCMRAGWCDKCKRVHDNPLKPQAEEIKPIPESRFKLSTEGFEYLVINQKLVEVIQAVNRHKQLLREESCK